MVTSLREAVVLFKFDAFGTRMLIINAQQHIAKEDVKLLTTVSSDGTSHRPNKGKKEQPLQPHGYLLTGHGVCTVGF